LRQSGGIVCLVFFDLESEELVDGGKRLRVRSDHDDACAVGDFREGVGNPVLEPLHFGDAGGRGVVDEHGNVEVALGEGVGDVGEMHADGVAGGGVFGVVGFNLDDAAVGLKEEVVGGSGLRETHALFASGVHSGVVVRGGF